MSEMVKICNTWLSVSNNGSTIITLSVMIVNLVGARFTVLGPSKKEIRVFDINLHDARYWEQPQPLSNADFDLFARTKTCRSISGKAGAEMMCCFEIGRAHV